MTPPPWFSSALATRPTVSRVDVDGASINALSWGDPSLPGVMLIHGGAAHAHWWSFIAPQLTHGYHVAALDLSGHGDSDHRHLYAMETWSAEVLAVAEHLGMDRPILIGHSMGGFVAMVAAALHGSRLAGTIIVDSPVRRPDPESEEGSRGRAFRNPKTYASMDEALDHFHLVPPQPCENRYIVDHIARHSLRQTDDGWTWKFDRRVFQRFLRQERSEYLATVSCRIAVLHGQFSAIVTPDVTDYMAELLGRNAPFVEIPQAHHHLMLDQPLAFLAAVRALLADWEHSLPARSGRTDEEISGPDEAADRLVEDALVALGIDYERMDCDPALADTAAFCAAYGVLPEDSANTILVIGKADPPRHVACVVLATTRLDVNRMVRSRLGVKKASFAGAEAAREVTGMAIGGVTAFGLPAGLPVWIDSAVMARESVVLGGGSRSWKIRCAPFQLLAIPAAEVVSGLAQPAVQPDEA